MSVQIIGLGHLFGRRSWVPRIDVISGFCGATVTGSGVDNGNQAGSEDCQPLNYCTFSSAFSGSDSELYSHYIQTFLGLPKIDPMRYIEPDFLVCKFSEGGKRTCDPGGE